MAHKPPGIVFRCTACRRWTDAPTALTNYGMLCGAETCVGFLEPFEILPVGSAAVLAAARRWRHRMRNLRRIPGDSERRLWGTLTAWDQARVSTARKYRSEAQ